MSFAQLLSGYVTLNLLIALAWLLLLALARKGTLSSTQELRTHYLALGSIVAISLLQPFLPKREFFEPPAKVWSAPSMATFAQHSGGPSGYIAIPAPSGEASIRADRASWLFFGVLTLALATGIARLGWDIRSLLVVRRRSYLIRRIGRVSVYSNDEIPVPYSYRLPSEVAIVIPVSLIGPDFKIALAHEVQHHRQGDTAWVYAIWALRTLCFANPAIHLWSRWLCEIQEFACDETLVDRNRVESRQYASCLIEVAQSALHAKRVPACATGLALRVERKLLKRRIERMLNPRKTKHALPAGLIGTVVVALMAATAFASQSWIQDRRVTLADAQAMASRVNSEFPVVVNDLVLAQLNRYIGTPEGREFMRTALQRMENYRPLVERKLADYDVPAELAAIPIIESGYQNLEETGQKGWGAGLWMFIKSTARNYGVRVDDQVDERLIPELLTDAAMRLLKAEKLRFKDWQLAVMAYNMGQSQVQKAIQATGSRDAWVLVRNGHENDPNYLPKVMAAILIMENPESVQ